MPKFIDDLLPDNLKKKNFNDECSPSDELGVYFVDSFGSYERLDYGTGIISLLLNLFFQKDMN